LSGIGIGCDPDLLAFRAPHAPGHRPGLLEATSPLYRVSHRLAETVTTEQIVAAIVDSVAETEADGCAVGRLGYGPDGEIESATFLGAWNRQGQSGFPIGVRFAADSSPLPLQMVTTFWTIEDVAQGPEMEGHQLSMLGAGARAFANIPLQVGEHVIGFVSVFRARPGPFSPVSLRLYETLVDQAAVALERARLLEETQARAARDRLVDQIGGQLQGLIDPDAILKTAVRELGRALGARQATIKVTGVRDGDGDGAS